MSARKRRRTKDTGNDDRGSNRGRSRGSSKKGRRGRGRPRRKRETVGFWGDAGKLPEARTDVQMTDDPAAVPRSLGPPPLPGHERIAEHYFAAVYDRAVGVAGALAAAGGLIGAEELVEESEDEDAA